MAEEKRQAPEEQITPAGAVALEEGTLDTVSGGTDAMLLAQKMLDDKLADFREAEKLREFKLKFQQ